MPIILSYSGFLLAAPIPASAPFTGLNKIRLI
uniref:Cytochrome b6-f complex subunit 6 n=4 Tax=Huperzia TaxID=37428 RepID=PETL_HUPLU|nr:cytochrome b6/f complex subunit VI [Huperzia serrata]YP_010424470.1 cytochrome b6/f complex subunit VI [Huperzia crispata]YP_010719095.1 cytochrome b6/f complex subunit VI [Huperzia arctica]YP_011031834.1 cytochrome b6/f complex subunit VI [Huperzia selago]YP_011031921.1 cytochrome b6/f complex subunit VI [Huperzia kunmingensis]YP_209511.1 cytochrome b6/f complex subunit VI [Huperzia lucidula]Q5SD33.1 RecName: Full=Cytochrome b6-f complex subunit 6; AltName: Full=Cytochrome b6-f complex su